MPSTKGGYHGGGKSNSANKRNNGGKSAENKQSSVKGSGKDSGKTLADLVPTREGWKVRTLSSLMRYVPKTKEDWINVGKGVQAGITRVKNFWTAIKGIFNDPEWYKFHGELMTPAVNPLRAFDPRSLKDAENGDNRIPGAGVGHVIKNAIKFSDPREIEGFDLATSELFRAMRLALRSNLPYSMEQFQASVVMAVSIAAKAKSIERTLGWHNVVRGDIPEFHDAIETTTITPTETGYVPVKRYKMTDEGYADLVTKYKYLTALCSQIPIPKKLIEYISWWVGTIFEDQSLPNPQIYMNELRSMLVYKVVDIDGRSSLEIANSDWDIADVDIDTVIREAESFIANFGVISADIVKTELYGTIDLIPIEAYNPVFVQDAEFFSVLINNYTLTQDQIADIRSNLNREYIRIDMLPELEGKNYVGVMNALATWAGVSTPFKITAQAVMLTFADHSRIYRSATGVAEVPAGAEVSVPVYEYLNSADIPSSVAAMQITSRQDNLAQLAEREGNSVTVNYDGIVRNWTDFTTDTVFTRLTASQRDTIPGTVSSIDLDEFVPITEDRQIPDNLLFDRAGFHYITLGTVATTLDYPSNLSYALAFRVEDKHVYLFPTFGAGLHEINDMFDLSDYISILAVGGTSIRKIQFNRAWTDLAPNSQSESTYKILASFVGPSARLTTFPIFLGSFNITVQTNASAMEYSIPNTGLTELFADLVDYHLPMYSYYDIEITTSNEAKVTFNHGVQLIKECYVPLIVSRQDVRSVLNWMYMGLFSV